jgi:hypothetical protein
MTEGLHLLYSLRVESQRFMVDTIDLKQGYLHSPFTYSKSYSCHYAIVTQDNSHIIRSTTSCA